MPKVMQKMKIRKRSSWETKKKQPTWGTPGPPKKGTKETGNLCRHRGATDCCLCFQNWGTRVMQPGILHHVDSVARSSIGLSLFCVEATLFFSHLPLLTTSPLLGSNITQKTRSTRHAAGTSVQLSEETPPAHLALPRPPVNVHMEERTSDATAGLGVNNSAEWSVLQGGYGPSCFQTGETYCLRSAMGKPQTKNIMPYAGTLRG